jgi:hypothetical protein
MSPGQGTTFGMSASGQSGSVARRGVQITLVGPAWTASRRTDTGMSNGGYLLVHTIEPVTQGDGDRSHGQLLSIRAERYRGGRETVVSGPGSRRPRIRHS